MHSFIAVAIIARSILFLPGAGASGGVETIHLRGADATFRGSTIKTKAASDLPRPARKNPQTEKDELMAAIVSARISEPDRVAGVLNELRVESTGHLGRLDLEEWSEMMAEMRSGGVALGTRNKLRILIAAQSSRSHTGRAALSGGWRRAQIGSGDEESSLRSGRQTGDSTSTEKQASEQELSSKSTSTIFGVSGDSAPPVPVSNECRVRFGIVGWAALLPLI